MARRIDENKRRLRELRRIRALVKARRFIIREIRDQLWDWDIKTMKRCQSVLGSIDYAIMSE